MKIQNDTAAMRPMSKPPSPQELIAKADEDADGALSKTEWQSITDKISLHHNVELNADDLLEQYDEDEDGVLSDSEAQNALAGIADQLGLKPPPPPPPSERGGTAENDLLQQGIRVYQENAMLGED